MTPFRQPWSVQRQAADVEKTRFGKRIPSLNVDFGDPDGKITRVRVFELRAHCCGQIGFAIVIEEEVRVKAPSGVCVSDIFCCSEVRGSNIYQTIAYWSTYIGSLHESSSQMFLVVTNILLGVFVEFY